MKLLYLFVPVLLLQNCKAQPSSSQLSSGKDENTLLWEISGNGLKKPSFMFGTFHLMCKEDIHISNNLRAAIKGADEVYFEMDLDDMSNTLGALFFMNMKNNKSLQDLYSAAEYEKVKNFFNDSLKTPISMLQRMKPLFLQALLYPKMMTCKNMTGLEEELMKIAKEDKKEIKGFETIEFQASVFDSIPYEDQAKELLKSIDSLTDYKKDFDTMMNVYLTQQLDEIEGLFSKSEFGMEKNQEILLDNRNRNWVEQIKKLSTDKSRFIGVGAGHLVGKNGLISLLRKAGYILRPIDNK